MQLRPFLVTALSAAVLAATSAAQAQNTPIKFQLDWRFEGPAALFLTPAAKGYFKDARLDVTVDAGNGSGGTVTRVASGSYDMGLADVAALPGGMVLSTGGGAVLRPENRETLRQFGTVLYLRASPEDIYRRVRHDRTRPLLQVANPLERLRELYAQRDGLYRETAHFVIETGRPTVSTLVNMVMMQLEMAQSAVVAAPSTPGTEQPSDTAP